MFLEIFHASHHRRGFAFSDLVITAGSGATLVKLGAGVNAEQLTLTNLAVSDVTADMFLLAL